MTGTALGQARRRPNVVWITTHDINPHLGSYAGVYPGAEDAVTPNLDDFAAQGVRFNNAYATAPVCAPSRSSLITGCYPTAIGTMHMRTKAVPPPEVRLLPEYFREAGYFTTLSGFTDFQMFVGPATFDAIGEGAHWRDRPTPDTPFFAQFHGGITHESQIYAEADAFRAATAHVEPSVRHDPTTVVLPPYHPDTPVFRESWARYHDLITELDHWVGELLDQLEADGLADNTVVVFCSDHGLGMPGAKRWATEAGLHEPLLIRWPGVLPAGAVGEQLVALMDLGPTILQACEIPIPDHMHGVPLIDERLELVAEPNEFLFASRDRMDEQRDMTRTVRDRRYRYTRNYHPDRSPMAHCDYPDGYGTWRELRRLCKDEAQKLALGEVPDLLTEPQRALVAPDKPAEELHDLLADPHQERNLVGDAEHAPALDRLRAALDAWQQRYGDLGLIDETELIETWRPGGHWQVTAPPVATVIDGQVQVSCVTEGASIAWTTDPPDPHAPRTNAEALPFWLAAMGMPEPDSRRWRLCCDATPPPLTGPVWLQASRLGFRSSEEVLLSEPQ